MAKGAGFGAASHGAGTARSYELGQQEGGGGKPGNDALGRGDGTDCTAGGVGDVLISPASKAGRRRLVRAALLDAQTRL